MFHPKPSIVLKQIRSKTINNSKNPVDLYLYKGIKLKRFFDEFYSTGPYGAMINQSDCWVNRDDGEGWICYCDIHEATRNYSRLPDSIAFTFPIPFKELEEECREEQKKEAEERRKKTKSIQGVDRSWVRGLVDMSDDEKKDDSGDESNESE